MHGSEATWVLGSSVSSELWLEAMFFPEAWLYQNLFMQKSELGEAIAREEMIKTQLNKTTNPDSMLLQGLSCSHQCGRDNSQAWHRNQGGTLSWGGWHLLRVGCGIPKKHQSWRGQQHCPQLTTMVTRGWTHSDMTAPGLYHIPSM